MSDRDQTDRAFVRFLYVMGPQIGVLLILLIWGLASVIANGGFTVIDTGDCGCPQITQG